MDHPIRRHSVTTIRLTITTVRRPAVPALHRPAITARRLTLPALRGRPSPTTARRLARTTSRRHAVAAVLASAVVLFAAVPAQVARLVMDSGIWDLPRLLGGAVPRPELSPHVLPLLMGSIVVLAVVSSSSGPRRRDRW